MRSIETTGTKLVLYVVDGLGLSGKTKGLLDLATSLDPRRFRAEVCSFSPDNGVFGERLISQGIPLHVLPCPDGLHFGMVLRLARLARAQRAAVVHCYNPRPIIYGGLAAKLAGIRRCVGSLSAFACQVPDRDYDFLPQPLTTSRRRNVYRNKLANHLVDHLVTVSRLLGERFCQYNEIRPYKLRVISYGVNVDSFQRIGASEIQAFRSRHGIAPEEILIGSVGRLVEQKDYPTQFRAFALALREVPNLSMILAGDGPLKDELEALARSLGIADRIHFLGLWQEVPLLMRSLDIFVLASKFEPYGVVLLEAKAAGVAIAATRVNEIPEILTAGKSGVLAEAGNAEDLARVIVTLSQDTALRAGLGRQALEEARVRHSSQAVVGAYQKLYESTGQA